MRATALLAALLVLVAGCVGTPAEPTETTGPEATDPTSHPVETAPRNATGTVVVLALFSDRTPLSGVTLAAGNATAVTDASGLGRLALPEGPHTVLATKAAHRDAQIGVEVRAGAETQVEVVLLAADGGQHAHKVGFAAHHDVYRFEGHFDCSATYVIITGDCLIVVENVTGMAGAPDPVSNTTTERHIIDFPLDLTWSHLVVEMAWDADPATDATGEGMSLALEPAEAPSDGHAAKYARVSGLSPLRIDLLPGVKHATATEDDMPNPLGGEVLRARAFVTGAGHNPGGTSFLGVGATTDHAFVLYVSIFYGDTAPADYTAVG